MRAVEAPEPVPAAPGDLPRTLGTAVRAELRRAFSHTYELPIVVAANGALMCSCWFLLPGAIKDQLFTLHGSVAFPLVLAAWMYSDVPATNVLGPDAPRVLLALDDPKALSRLLVAKAVVLWLLITPLCVVIDVITGLVVNDLTTALLASVWIVVVPFGALAFSFLVGIRWPYHPMPVRYRWQHRQPRRRMLVRWLILVLTPYGLVPVLATALMVPTLILWGTFSVHGLSGRLPDQDYGWGVGVACCMAVVCVYLGHRAALAMVRRRRDQLETFLADPTTG